MAERPVAGQPAVDRASTEYVVRDLRDPDEIRAMLAPHRTFSAYALGQLQPGLFEKTEWHVARGAAGEALLLHSKGGLGNALFSLGAPGALEAALQLHPGPKHTFLSCQTSHKDVVSDYFGIPRNSTMVRLRVDRETFQPEPGNATRLSGRDVFRVNNLYRADGTAAFYTADNINQATYYGVFADERLVAVAGTHVVSPVDEIAVVGNVFTHPFYRGQGFGRLVTSAVTQEVLKTCREAVLSVDPANVAAVRAYGRLGYQEVMRLIEGPAARREAGTGAFVRRQVAAIRGRRYGGELVTVQPRTRKEGDS